MPPFIPVLSGGRTGRTEVPLSDLPSLIAFNQKAVYDFDNFLARLVDNSEHLEFRPVTVPKSIPGW